MNTEEVVRVWDVVSGKELREFAFGLGPLRCVAFAPDGLRAAVGREGGFVVWDMDL